mmetsp:Transcript_130434/g.194151  ORF Transcript_130434/g.194151 Transcript_130434/m.194151 type:complete len:233 (+) Transcript_130434:3223-3921(+)
MLLRGQHGEHGLRPQFGVGTLALHGVDEGSVRRLGLGVSDSGEDVLHGLVVDHVGLVTAVGSVVDVRDGVGTHQLGHAGDVDSVGVHHVNGMRDQGLGVNILGLVVVEVLVSVLLEEGALLGTVKPVVHHVLKLLKVVVAIVVLTTGITLGNMLGFALAQHVENHAELDLAHVAQLGRRVRGGLFVGTNAALDTLADLGDAALLVDVELGAAPLLDVEASGAGARLNMAGLN